MTKRNENEYAENLHKVSRYPLTWPSGWVRTLAENRREARFGKRAGRRISVSEGVHRLLDEIGRIKATHSVVSTNVPPKKDGLPGSYDAGVTDPGVAVYFVLNGTPCCFACDKWDKVGDNLTAIASHIKTLRDQIRWGVSTLDRAFEGYKILPEYSWWKVLDIPQECTRQEAQTAFRNKAKQIHPDQGGDHDEMSYLNEAWTSAQKHFDELEGK